MGEAQRHGGEVVVRDAEPSDAAAVATVGRAAFAAAHAGILPPTAVQAVVAQAYSDEAVRDSIGACVMTGGYFLVAQAADSIVGFLHYAEPDGRPELHRLYVDPSLTGGGIGSRLLDELDARVGSDGRYVLMVAAANTGAVRFYRRRGFTVVATVDGLAHYHELMGVEFPASAAPVPALLMRRGG